MLDLTLIWAILIAVAVFLYVLLDGFDLGVGILTAIAGSETERDTMTATIEPVWDGNETWLILGGGGLFAAFPLAYAVLMPAFYLPIGFMLTALIFRGVAFEFRHKAVRRKTKIFWNSAFAGGSLLAALSQGLILGGFIQGVEVDGRAFAGGSMDWFTPFSVLVAVSLAAGYILLGACWIIYKTEDDIHDRARLWARRAALAAALGLAAVSLATLYGNPEVTARWGLSWGALNIMKALPMLPVPLIGAFALWRLWATVLKKCPDGAPFIWAVIAFISGYLGLALSIFPYLVPFELTIWDTATLANAQGFMLVGAVIMLPVILGYTGFVYWLFRGKVKAGDLHV